MAVDGNQYILIEQPRSWSSALGYCRALGGTLATWSSQSDYNRIRAVHDEARSTYTWVGLNDRYSEGVWKFVDGDTSYCGSDCDNIPQWFPGEPNDYGSGEDCAEMDGFLGDRLNDQDCSEGRWFVCEIPDCEDMVIGDVFPAPEVPLLGEPNYFVLNFASGEQGTVIMTLAMLNLVLLIVAVYACCVVKKLKAKVPYSKVVQYSEDEQR